MKNPSPKLEQAYRDVIRQARREIQRVRNLVD